jgi:hypothetical protein
MDLHFISTAPEFYYLHMISILTAKKVHNVGRINFWCTSVPTSIYWDKVKNMVEVNKLHAVALPALEGKDANFVAAHLKDYWQWKILNAYGGLYLDLDTISISDATDLLNRTDECQSGAMAHPDLIASLDVEDVKSIAFPYNNAVVLAVKHSPITQRLAQISEALFNMTNMPWGMSGPILLSMVAGINEPYFQEVPHKVFNPYGGNEILAIYSDHPEHIPDLPLETRVVHLYAKASPQFKTIDAKWVQKSTSVLSKVIQSVLSFNGWYVVPGWDETGYLAQRGQHYKGLFDAIRRYHPVNIMEIGTSSGQTAIGMIKVAGKFQLNEESDIQYYGIDLFETGNTKDWEAEFTGGYVPPTKETVKNQLMNETGAKITLVAVDSRLVQKTHYPVVAGWPKMDLIFIDGGHSLETVASDWEYAKSSMHEKTVVVLDDYFPELPFIGAKTVVDNIDRSVFDVKIMPEIDDYTHSFGRLRTQLVVVRFRQPEPVKPIAKPWAKDVLSKVLPGNVRLEVMAAPGRVSRSSND